MAQPNLCRCLYGILFNFTFGFIFGNPVTPPKSSYTGSLYLSVIAAIRRSSLYPSDTQLSIMYEKISSTFENEILLSLLLTLEKDNNYLYKPESSERMKKGLILFGADILD